LRPSSLNRITSEKNDFKIWEIPDHSLNVFVIQYGISRGNVTREKRSLRCEQLRVTPQIGVGQRTEFRQFHQKPPVAFILATGGIPSFDSAQGIEVMQFLYRRHPEIRMQSELVMKPRGSTFLSPNAQKIRACVAR
jgi:hypothetical protein